MAQIFLSFSSKDMAQARQVRDWIEGENIGSLFWSPDGDKGIKGGEEWEKVLYRELLACRIFLPLVSRNWLDSKWCFTELCFARASGRAIIPIRLDECDAGAVTPELQDIRIAIDAADAARRLTGRLGELLRRRAVRLAPGIPVFPGLAPFEAERAAVFFGRDEEIAALTEKLRAQLPRPLDGRPRAVALTGASGTGKSSLLRAGLLPDLKAPGSASDFLAIGPIRARDGIGGPAEGFCAALARAIARSPAKDDVLEALPLARVLAEKPKDLAAALGDHVTAGGSKAVLLAIDQAEELLAGDGALTTLLRRLLLAKQPPIVGLFTVRDDKAVAVRSLFDAEDFLLKPLDAGRLASVIRDPLLLAGHPFEDAFVQALVRDAEAAADPLPLVAHLLAQMERRSRSFTLAGYQTEGGLAGAISGSAEAIFGRFGAEAQAAAHGVFVPLLASVAPDGRAKLESLPLASVPDTARNVIDAFIDERLLHTRTEGGTAMVEPAHEALLRQWPRLAAWIESERANLMLLSVLERDAGDWQRDGRPGDRLLHRGDRLTEAQGLLALTSFTPRVSQAVRDYVLACASRERADADEKSRREREVAEAVAMVLAKEAADANETHHYERGIRYALAGWLLATRAGAPAPAATVELARGAAASRLLHCFGQHVAAANPAAVSPDGSHIVTASDDATARVWDVQTGDEVVRLEGHADWVFSAAYSPSGNRIVTASRDNTARIWDARTGSELLRLEGHAGSVRSSTYSPDGSRIVTASGDKKSRVWDAQTGSEVLRLEGHGNLVNSATYSPDGGRIVTASDDNTARVWDAQTGSELLRLEGHTDCVNSAAFSPDGSCIVTAARDNTAQVWDAQTGSPLSRLEGHGNWLASAAFSPDGNRIVTASWDETARVWDAQTGRELLRLEGYTDAVRSALFSPAGSCIVTVSDGATARVWDTQEECEPVRLEGHASWISSAAFSPDGGRIVTASGDKIARVWDAQTGHKLMRLTGHTDWVRSAIFSRDGSRIVTASDDKTARLWDAQTGSELLRLEGHANWINSAVFSPDGRRIVTASDDMVARLWDAQTGEELLRFEGHANWISSAAFSPDGRRIVTASGDKTARLWDAQTGNELLRLEDYAGVVFCAAFSPDGHRIVSGSEDKIVRVWDTRTGNESIRLVGHGDSVFSAVFSPDGSRIATGSRDKTVRVWDTQTGSELFSLDNHPAWVRSVAYSPDGGRIATVADDAAAVWQLPASIVLTGEKLLSYVCREKLQGVEAFTDEEIQRSAVGPLLSRNPVEACLNYLAEREQSKRQAGTPHQRSSSSRSR